MIIEFEQTCCHAVYALCLVCFHLSIKEVAVGQHFHYFVRSFPVESLKFLFAQLGIVLRVKTEHKLIEFQRSGSALLVIVSFMFVVSNYDVC